MKFNQLCVSSGDSRAAHAAQIQHAGSLYNQYADLHHETFTTNKLNKAIVVNSKGDILGRFADKQEARSLVVNADGTVRHEDFMVIQDRIVEVRRRSLNGIADLKAAGLTFGVSITDQIVGFEKINDFQEAKQEQNPNSYQNNDTVFTEDYVANPITHQSFQVPWRQQGFDYKRSLGLATSIRQVSERLEETLFNGNASVVVSFNGSNHPIYGYTTHPDRGTGNISDWNQAANIDKIVDEVIDNAGAMFSDQGGVSNKSLMLYVANDIHEVFQKDYKVGVTGTVLERVKKISYIKDVKAAEKLAPGTAVLVEMEARTVELAVASDIISVPHTKTHPMEPQVLTTYAAMVQQIKSDTNNNTGVRHLTTP